MMPSLRLFSKQIGEDPSFLRGKSFLLEVDPTSPYEKGVGDFADELLIVAAASLFSPTRAVLPTSSFQMIGL